MNEVDARTPSPTKTRVGETVTWGGSEQRSCRSCLTAGITGLAAPGFSGSLGVTARKVARLLVVCGVGNEACRGQVIQERKSRPMLAVCQLTDARGGMRGRQRERMDSTLLEGRGRARRRLGEAQDADEQEMFMVMPGDGSTADSHQTRKGTLRL